MNLSIDCKVSLSKKLRSIVNGQECSIVLTTSDLVNGKGEGRLSISCEGDYLNDFDTNETSIMITPVNVSDEVPDNRAVSSIFANNIPPQNRTGERTPADKMAVTKAPSKKNVPHAIVPKEEVVTPEEFKQLDSPKCKKYIMDLDTLIQAARAVSKNEVDIDLGSARNERERALLLEQKRKGQSIGTPAYIVNDKAGVLSINDLDLVLICNAPFNLANLPGKRVAESGELRGLLNAGIVKFISPAEAQEYMNKMDREIIKAPTLDVFDNRYEAESNMVEKANGPSIQADIMELTMEDLERPTTEESMIIDLTENIDPTLQSEGRKTSRHGSIPRTSSHQANENIDMGSDKSPAHATVRKISR